MSTTLLEIGNAIAIKAGLPTQTRLIGNSDKTAELILQCVVDGAQKDAFRDHDWSILQNTETFTTTGRGYYSLPADFDRVVGGTVYDLTNDCELIGPVGPAKWHRLNAESNTPTGITRYYRFSGVASGLIGNIDEEPLRLTINIFPDEASSTIPNAAADPIEVSYEYIHKKFIRSRSKFTEPLVDQFGTDNDYPFIDPDVIEAAALWRLLRSLGMSYADEVEEYKALIDERKANDGSAETLDMRGRSVIFGPNIPETGFGG